MTRVQSTTPIHQTHRGGVDNPPDGRTGGGAADVTFIRGFVRQQIAPIPPLKAAIEAHGLSPAASLSPVVNAAVVCATGSTSAINTRSSTDPSSVSVACDRGRPPQTIDTCILPQIAHAAVNQTAIPPLPYLFHLKRHVEQNISQILM